MTQVPKGEDSTDDNVGLHSFSTEFVYLSMALFWLW